MSEINMNVPFSFPGCRVLETFSSRYRGPMVFVTAGDQTIQATLLHPIFVVKGQGLEMRPRLEHLPDLPPNTTPSGRWVDAGDLQTGDELMLIDGRILPIREIHTEHCDGNVHNFEVEELHTYVVGPLGVLVHNNSGLTPAQNTIMWRFRLIQTARDRIQYLQQQAQTIASSEPGAVEAAYTDIESGVLPAASGFSQYQAERLAAIQEAITAQQLSIEAYWAEIDLLLPGL